VIDTNVFISSLLSTKGKPRRLIDLWRFEKITLCVSKEILAEYFMVLGRFGLAMEPEGKKLMRLFQTLYNLVYIGSALSVSVILENQIDDMFLKCAVGAEASYLVSGDRHLLNLKSFDGIPIVAPSEFLKLLQ
jgi:hypothetical protein